MDDSDLDLSEDDVISLKDDMNDIPVVPATEDDKGKDWGEGDFN